MEHLVKRMVTKDGKFRVSVYQDIYAESPRDMTDEPMHCEDWARNYSIMDKKERENKSSSARRLIEYLLGNFGDEKKIIGKLIENGKIMDKGRMDFGSALVYDRSRRGYILYETTSHFYSYKKDNGWYENEFFDGKRDDLDLVSIIDAVSDEAIDYLANHCMTDKVNIASYGFGYNGEVSFYDTFGTDSEGIAWLEKDEFLKYSGCSEEQWKMSFTELEFLCKEIEAWSNGECYYFVVEEAVTYKVHKEYLSCDKEAEDYEETEWKEIDQCSGFYGDVDYVIDFVCEDREFNKEDLEDAA